MGGLSLVDAVVHPEQPEQGLGRERFHLPNEMSKNRAVETARGESGPPGGGLVQRRVLVVELDLLDPEHSAPVGEAQTETPLGVCDRRSLRRWFRERN
jgi:hypothetical protein